MAVVIATLAGELGIKGKATRSHMVSELIANIKSAVNLKDYQVMGGTLVLNVEGDVGGLSRVFGIAKYAPAVQVKYSDLSDLVAKASEAAKDDVKGKRFAVRSSRSHDEDRFTSMDINRALGSALLPYSGGVDLEDPEVTVHVDVVSRGLALVYTDARQGARGLPVGVAGRTVSLVSGGIDSPVATWMMMKRGVVPVMLNLDFGGGAQRQAVLEEAKVLRAWSGRHDIKVYFVDGLEVLKSLAQVRRDLRVVVLKRVMYRLAEELSRREGAHSITTGESLSQVSSQTMWNLEAEEYGISLPVLRPLIGMDKDEIVSLARRIGTYELSSKVPEYCAISQSSTTRANLEDVVSAEQAMNLGYRELVSSAEVVKVTRDGLVRAGSQEAPRGG